MLEITNSSIILIVVLGLLILVGVFSFCYCILKIEELINDEVR